MSCYGGRLSRRCRAERRNLVKEGYRLLLVDKDGVLVSEFQLTENALAQSEAFVAGLRDAIESIEEEEP